MAPVPTDGAQHLAQAIRDTSRPRPLPIPSAGAQFVEFALGMAVLAAMALIGFAVIKWAVLILVH